LHHEGLQYQGRSYKPLLFSNLQFAQRRNRLTHMFVRGPVTLFVDSIQEKIIQSLIKGIWTAERCRLLDVDMPLQQLELQEAPTFSKCMQYHTLSPIVVPVRRGPRLHFCHPLESEFYDQLRKSIANWYQLKWGEPFSSIKSIHISLLNPERFQWKKASSLFTYKKRNLKGYHLSLEIVAPPKVQQVFYEAGAGSLGSQGCGMLEVQKEG
jgi:CRISPR-associated endoribonuclease Cas6